MSYERPVGVRDTRVCGSCSARVDEEDVGRLPALAGRPEIDRLHICGPTRRRCRASLRRGLWKMATSFRASVPPSAGDRSSARRARARAAGTEVLNSYQARIRTRCTGHQSDSDLGWHSGTVWGGDSA